MFVYVNRAGTKGAGSFESSSAQLSISNQVFPDSVCNTLETCMNPVVLLKSTTMPRINLARVFPPVSIKFARTLGARSICFHRHCIKHPLPEVDQPHEPVSLRRNVAAKYVLLALLLNVSSNSSHGLIVSSPQVTQVRIVRKA